MVFFHSLKGKLKLLERMEKYHDVLQGVTVVPAGLTKYRDKLYPLAMFTKNECISILDTVNAVGDRCKALYGKRIFFCSDELYLKAERKIPDEEYYEGYLQLEDGVGSIRSSADEVDFTLEDLSAYDLDKPRSLSIATGVAAYPFISETVEKLKVACGGSLNCKVYEIKNNFFGENITVAGLLTGKDIAEQLIGKPFGDRLLIPEVAVRREGELFLDSMSKDELSEKLGVPVFAVTNDGYDIVSSILYDE